jgi:probable rRNA maturation factor
MAELHMRYMGLPGPTDVLSFPSNDAVNRPVDPESLQDELTLGDIVICPDFIESNTHSEPTQMSVDACIVHGTLHLLGYDHQNDADAATMSRLENQLVRGWAQFKR